MSDKPMTIKEKILAEQSMKNTLVVSTEEPVLTHPAVGTFRGPGGWYIAKIMYNPLTGEAGKFEKIGTGDDRSTIIERFKIEVAKTDILG